MVRFSPKLPIRKEGTLYEGFLSLNHIALTAKDCLEKTLAWKLPHSMLVLTGCGDHLRDSLEKVAKKFNMNINTCSFFKKDFIYLFLERGERREKEREKNINMCPSWGPGWQPRHVP